MSPLDLVIDGLARESPDDRYPDARALLGRLQVGVGEEPLELRAEFALSRAELRDADRGADSGSSLTGTSRSGSLPSAAR